jgi:three-Cys-motif partner protein
MRKQKWCKEYVYVDAFAGPGEHVIRRRSKSETPQGVPPLFPNTQQADVERQEFVDGSPRVALSIEHPFTRYVFVELNPARAERLRALQAKFPDRTIHVRETDCNEYIREKLVNRSKNFWSTRRAVVFLDPFGMQVPWETVEGLASTGAVEVIINFPVGTIQRLLHRDGEFTVAQRDKLNWYLGSPDWFDVLYRIEHGLFGDAVQKLPRSGNLLAKWYCNKRLSSCFNFVSSPRLVKNTHGVYLYYLIHAGHNKTAHKIANDILSVGEAIR